jgi:hypothetical protein
MVVKPDNAASSALMICTGAAELKTSCLMREPETTTDWTLSASVAAEAAGAAAAVWEKAGAAAAAQAMAISERRNRRAGVAVCTFMEFIEEEDEVCR